MSDSENSAGQSAASSKRTFDHPEYKLRKKLGQGGMAAVYLATQVKLDRLVAIKIMSTRMSQNQGFKKRFVREARTLAKFRHPNIITIYEVEGFAGRPFLVMEYLDGGDLKARMKTGMGRNEILACMRQVAAALEYAHGHSYVHRDIKPENCMFDSNGRLVLTDFGIARSADSDATQLTQMGVSIGTPAYMAPEQFESSNVDARADLYSLGVMLFELLAGSRPFTANSAAAMLFKHASEPVPALPDDVSDLQPLVDWLMAKKPDDRPATATEVIEKLDELLEDNSDALESVVVRQEQIRAREAEVAAIAASERRAIDDAMSGTGETQIRDTGRSSNPLLLAGAAGLLVAALGGGALWWSLAGDQPDVDDGPGEVQTPVVAVPEPAPVPVTVPETPRSFSLSDDVGIIAEISAGDDIAYAYDSLVALDGSAATAQEMLEGWQFFVELYGEEHPESPLFAEAVERADGWTEVIAYQQKEAEGALTAMDYYYRGYGYQMARRYEAALSDYETSLQMDPANSFVVEFADQVRAEMAR